MSQATIEERVTALEREVARLTLLVTSRPGGEVGEFGSGIGSTAPAKWTDQRLQELRKPNPALGLALHLQLLAMHGVRLILATAANAKGHIFRQRLAATEALTFGCSTHDLIPQKGRIARLSA